MDSKEYQRLYRERHREKAKAYARAYYENQTPEQKQARAAWGIKNPEKLRACKLKSNQKKAEKRKAYNQAWAKANPGKVTAYSRAYQLAKTKATPPWLSDEQKKAIETFYVNRPEGFHVDHKVPLNGKQVCGLHVPWNLQYLSASENIKKSNKLE